jgi:ribosomal protein S6--L-glutamate ligase
MHAVVLTRNRFTYASRRIISAFTRRRHTVTIVDPLQACIGIEGGNYPIVADGKAVAPAEIVIARTSPLTRGAVLAILRQYEHRRPALINRSAAVEIACNKFSTLQALAGIGIPVPRTRLLWTDSALEEAIEAVGGPPVVIKTPDGAKGRGVALAETMAAARSTAQAMLDAAGPVLVQEFFAEARSTDIRALVIGGEVAAAARRTGRKDDFRANTHCGGRMEVMELSAELAGMASAAAIALGLECAGVDLLETARGPVVIEINSTPGLRGIEEASGLDLAGRLAEHAESLAARVER